MTAQEAAILGAAGLGPAGAVSPEVIRRCNESGVCPEGCSAPITAASQCLQHDALPIFAPVLILAIGVAGAGLMLTMLCVAATTAKSKTMFQAIPKIDAGKTGVLLGLFASVIFVALTGARAMNTPVYSLIAWCLLLAGIDRFALYYLPDTRSAWRAKADQGLRSLGGAMRDFMKNPGP